MKDSVKVYFDFGKSKEKIEKIAKEIYKNLIDNVIKGAKKDEFPPIEIEETSDEESADIIITSKIKKDPSSGKYILFVKDNVTPDHLKLISKSDVKIVIFERSFLSEYEEKGKFEKALKELIRELMMQRELNEAAFKKKVTWKFNIKRGSEPSIEASLFLDASMREIRKKIINIKKNMESIWKDLFEKSRKKSKKVASMFEGEKFDDLKRELKEISKDIEKLRGKLSTYPSVLLTGPTGSGKSFLAKIISETIMDDFHMLTISTPSIPPQIIDGELFGSVKGAYTDAKSRPGAMISKMGGVVFLDEIAEVLPETQAKILVYMSTLKVKPEGLDFELPAPVFLIAATNKNVEEEMRKGNFREDLYHRFRWKIKVPSLEDRKSEMRFLISFILVNRIASMGKNPKDFYITYRAIQKLEEKKYPGNFRELESVISEALENAVSSDRNIVMERDIP